PDGTLVYGTTVGTGENRRTIPDSTSALFANLDARFGGNRELWMNLVDSVFRRYSALTGVKFDRCPDDGAPHPSGAQGVPGVRGDIRIALRPVDGPGRTLAYAAYHVTLDEAEDWGSFAFAYNKLRNVLSHEVGHALGLGHVCPVNETRLMEP